MFGNGSYLMLTNNQARTADDGTDLLELVKVEVEKGWFSCRVVDSTNFCSLCHMDDVIVTNCIVIAYWAIYTKLAKEVDTTIVWLNWE